MANPNFTATMSSNEIWRDLDDTRCITDDLDAIESNINRLQTGKANSDHSHNEYSHTNHTHNYNDLTNKPYIPEAYVHPDIHPASMITGLSTVANTGNYTDLTNKPIIPSEYSHPESHPASMITGLSTVATTGSYNDLADKPTIPTIPASLPAIEDSTYSGCYYRTVNGVNQWINPPLIIGVEYPTIERWNNKVVYTKLVSIGAIQDASSVDIRDYGITRIVRYFGWVDTYALPYINADNLTASYSVYYSVRTTTIDVNCGTAMVGRQGYIQLWYTKD